MPERQQYQFDRDAQRRVERDLLDQKAASSRPGQVYHTMTSLQDRMSRPGYTPAQADTDQLKSLRRDWNRNQKYTPQGMRVSGATTPMGAQDAFRRDTETFRQANPQAYGRMYPLSQAAMKLGESGGLLGLGIRGLTGQLGDYYKSIMNKDGINAALDTDEAELENYANLTYGPHLEGIIEGPERSEVIHSPHDLIYNRGEGLDFDDDPKQPYVEPDDYVEDDFGDFYFDDSGREDYIAASGMNPYLLRDEKLESIHPEDQRMFEPMTPHLDRETPINIGVEFGVQDEIPPINYDYDPRTESGIMDAMRWSPPRQAFPPIGPHDPYDPDQRIFENRAKYDEWLRRQRMGP